MKQENGLLNILFNIIIPVLILNKLGNFIGPLNTLILALLFPLLYGVIDFANSKKINFISILGLLNVLVTGGLALLGLKGIWFAIKEATFPLLIGVFAFVSAFSKKPFIETILLNPQIFNIDLIWKKLTERDQTSIFNNHIKNATMYLSGSFFISAILNFVIAIRIFTPINNEISPEAQAEQLNQQIAQMTTYGSMVIMLPSFLILMGIFWYLLNGIKQTTGLKWEELLVEH